MSDGFLLISLVEKKIHEIALIIFFNKLWQNVI